MFTCRDEKGGELSSRASKMLYKPPGAVYIASYKERLDQSDCWKLWNYAKTHILCRTLPAEENNCTNSLGPFHSSPNSENFQTGTNGTEISSKSFQKIRKLLNFHRKSNSSTKNLENFEREPQMERKFPQGNFQNFRSTSQGCHLFRKSRILLFHSSLERHRIQKFKPEFFSEWKAPCVSRELLSVCEISSRARIVFDQEFISNIGWKLMLTTRNTCLLLEDI